MRTNANTPAPATATTTNAAIEILGNEFHLSQQWVQIPLPVEADELAQRAVKALALSQWDGATVVAIAQLRDGYMTGHECAILTWEHHGGGTIVLTLATNGGDAIYYDTLHEAMASFVSRD
jgi:hypothetical protein